MQATRRLRRAPARLIRCLTGEPVFTIEMDPGLLREDSQIPKSQCIQRRCQQLKIRIPGESRDPLIRRPSR